jgi:hypothetical protein
MPEMRRRSHGLIAKQHQIKRPMNISDEEIQRRAYQLWELEGKPFGDDERFWREAAAELGFRRAREQLKRRLAVRRSVAVSNAP